MRSGAVNTGWLRDQVLDAVGNTPLVRLGKLTRTLDAAVFAKLELLNPGGSIKDRAASSILAGAIAAGDLVPGHTVVIESSSGNLGIGLAQFCRNLDCRFICVVDSRTTGLNLAILKALGAEIDFVTDRAAAGPGRLAARLARVRELLAVTPGAFWPNQYANERNAAAHHATMSEIVQQLGAPPDFLFCATGTCGTLRGCTDFVTALGLATQIIPVDALGSAIFGAPDGERLIPGHGSALRPALVPEVLDNDPVHVSDAECVAACRRMALTEGLLVGGSSGAVLSALYRIRDVVPAGASCVLIFPDRGERYLDTIYSDEWVGKRIGPLPRMWPDVPDSTGFAVTTAE